VLATDVFEWFSVASGRLGVELDFRLVSTLVPPLFVESAMFLLPLPETQHKIMITDTLSIATVISGRFYTILTLGYLAAHTTSCSHPLSGNPAF
jgi:hypothetical protein